VGGRRRVPDDLAEREPYDRTLGQPLAEHRGGDGRPEQRPRHELVGARLQRHGDVQRRTAPAAVRLRETDRRHAHLGERPPRGVEGSRRVVLRRARQVAAAQVRGPLAQARGQLDVLVGDPDRHRHLLLTLTRPKLSGGSTWIGPN